MPDFSTRPRRPRLRAADLAMLVAAAVVLAAAGHAAYRAGVSQRESHAVVAALRAEIDASRRRVRALEAERGGAADVLASQVLLTADAPPSLVLYELAQLMSPDVRLVSLALRYGDRLDLDLTLRARAGDAYDVLLARLAESPRFENLRPSRENRGDEVNANLEVTFRAMPELP